MKITEKAKNYIIENTTSKPATIRVSSSGMGCGGPDSYVSLDETERSDKVVVIEDIQVYVQNGLLQFVEDWVIDLIDISNDRHLVIIDPDLIIWN